MEDQVPEEEPDGPFWRTVLFYFGLWTLLIGCGVLLILNGTPPPTSGNCVGPNGAAPCAAMNMGDLSKAERAVFLGLFWLVSAVGLLVIMARGWWQRKHSQPGETPKVRRDEGSEG